MSHAANEADTFDQAVVVPEPLDTDYTETIPQGLQSLANRTNNLGATLGALNTATQISWDQQPESFFVGDTDGSFPFFMPPRNRATNLTSALGNIAAKIIGAKQIAANAIAATNTTVTTLQNSLGTLQAALVSAESNYGPRLWGLGLSQDFTFFPQLLFGNNLQSTTLDYDYWQSGTHLDPAPIVRQGNVALTGVPAMLYVPPLPVNAKILYVEITCASPVSHSGSLAGMTPPSVGLYALPSGSASTPSLIVQASDTSVSAAAYEAVHTIRATPTSAVPTNPSSAYMLKVTGEFNGNAQSSSFVIYSCRIGLG